MSNDKAQGMFAKLAQQQAKAVREETPPAVEAPPSEAALPPAPPAEAKPKRAAPKPKQEPVKGKRHHPDYCQANCYVPKALRREVERELLDMDGMDYSSLIESLLERWLKSRRSSG